MGTRKLFFMFLLPECILTWKWKLIDTNNKKKKDHLKSGSDLKIKFELLKIEEFCIPTESDYKKLSIKAVTKLFLFATSYSFKTGFLLYLPTLK